MPHHFRIPLPLAVVLFVAEVIIMVLAQAGNTGQDFDLFTPLAALMPGQPVDDLEAFSPTCQQAVTHKGPLMKCSIHLDAPPLIQANITANEAVIVTLSVDVDLYHLHLSVACKSGRQIP